MEITGKIILKLPLAQGTSKAGNAWQKQEYVLETQESFPRKVHFDFFGDKVNQYPLEVNKVYRISFDIESREFNGRWYTDIRAWRAEDAAVAPAAAPAAPAAAPAAPQPAAPAPAPDFLGGDEKTDDLPF